MSNDDLPKVPKAGLGDHAHSFAKIALNVAGQALSASQGSELDAPLGELFGLIVQAPLERRRNLFLEKLRNKVIELAETFELFRSPDFWLDPRFTSALLNALPAAVQTHNLEKLDALRNCVINSVILESVDDDLRSMVYGILGRVTPTHLYVLEYLGDRGRFHPDRPGRGVKLAANGWIENFDEAFPEVAGRHYAFHMALKDLFELGLARSKPINMPAREVRPMPRYNQATGKSYTPTHEELIQEEILKRTEREEISKKGNMINLWDTEISLSGKLLLQMIDEPETQLKKKSADPKKDKGGGV